MLGVKLVNKFLIICYFYLIDGREDFIFYSSLLVMYFYVLYIFIQNLFEQFCIIIIYIFVGEKFVVMFLYFNFGCKIMEINGQGLRGFFFEKVKVMLQRVLVLVMLII